MYVEIIFLTMCRFFLIVIYMLSYLPDKNSYSRVKLNNSGFSHFYIFIFALVLVSGFSIYRQSSISKKDKVLGESEKAIVNERNGFSVLVKSNGPTWDFYEYLCKSLDECKTAPESGYQLPLISGGLTEGHEIIVEPSNEWNGYKYLKFYVKGGWGQDFANFRLVNQPRINGTELGEFNDMSYVIVPVSSLKNTFDSSTVFSN